MPEPCGTESTAEKRSRDGCRVVLLRPAPETRESRRAVLTPRAAVGQDDDHQLRRHALAALNLGLPFVSDDLIDLTDKGDDGSAGIRANTTAIRCSCLKRSGQCSCADDRFWLQSKRREASTYVAPHLRQVSARLETSEVSPAKTGDARGLDAATCVCLRRSGRCTCSADSTWLQRKRRCIVPYVPPYVKARQADLDRLRAKVAIAADAEPSHGSDRGSTASGGSVNIRTLARQWDSRLENRGECRFNPLQMDGQLVLEDSEGLTVECVDHALATTGVKGLPVIQRGRYQYEVELLRDSALMVGWSGAMTLPGCLDFQGYCYSSTGSKWHGQEEVGAYGMPFGKKGDIVGALLSWGQAETGSTENLLSLQISFVLNGRLLDTAFEVATAPADSTIEALVPMQPHICQLAAGPMLKVRLRGSATGQPLAHPVDGYQPLLAVSDGDFCPFSKAVAVAAAERVVAGVNAAQLQNFQLPDGHIAELYDIIGGTSVASLTATVARCLGIAHKDGGAIPAGILHIRFTEPDAASSSTALLACRRPGHVDQLVARCTTNGTALPFTVRPLRHAATNSKECIRAWRGEEFRPQADCSAARRLIHGCLQSPMPLPHLVEERSRTRSGAK